MEFRAELRNLRISPRKVHTIIEAIKKSRNVETALAVLQAIPNKSSRPLRKLLQSAMANARHLAKVPPEALSIKSFFVTEGPRVRRGRPRERGRVSPFYRRTSHVNLLLESAKNFTPVRDAEKEKPAAAKETPAESAKREYTQKLADEKLKRSQTKSAGERYTRKVIP